MSLLMQISSNLMQISSNKGFCSFTLGSALKKSDVWNGPKYMLIDKKIFIFVDDGLKLMQTVRTVKNTI